MSRWVCPDCEREFGARNQSHVCAPGMSVEELLGRHPEWVAELYAAVLDAVQPLGPVHEDAVNVGVFLKAERTFAEFRPRVRSVLLWVILPEEHPIGAVGRIVRSGSSYAHTVVLRTVDQVDAEVEALLQRAYDHAAD